MLSFFQLMFTVCIYFLCVETKSWETCSSLRHEACSCVSIALQNTASSLCSSRFKLCYCLHLLGERRYGLLAALLLLKVWFCACLPFSALKPLWRSFATKNCMDIYYLAHVILVLSSFLFNSILKNLCSMTVFCSAQFMKWTVYDSIIF